MTVFAGLTFNLFLDWLGGVEPVADMVVVRVLEPEVILLYDVHLIVDFLQELLTGRLFLK